MTRTLIGAVAFTLLLSSAHVRATPLHSAVGNGHETVVAALLAVGAEVNSRANESSATPLQLVAASGDVAMIEALPNDEAEISARGHRKVSS